MSDVACLTPQCYWKSVDGWKINHFNGLRIKLRTEFVKHDPPSWHGGKRFRVSIPRTRTDLL